ncbi:MAG: PKD domain-containing protein [bacterium]|nr:PKD domain-containing protein [bacterium]
MKPYAFLVLVINIIVSIGCNEKNCNSTGPTIQNRPPEIVDIGYSRNGLDFEVTAIAVDPDNDSLSYTWFCERGTVFYPTQRHTPLYLTDSAYVKLIVSDGQLFDKDSIFISRTSSR